MMRILIALTAAVALLVPAVPASAQPCIGSSGSTSVSQPFGC